MIVRLLISLLIIIGVGASSISAAKALLSDQVTLAANSFSTGTVDLQIAIGSSGDYKDSQSGFVEALLPGQTKSKIIKLKNNGSGVALAIAAQAANVSGLPDDKVSVAFTPWTSSSLTTGVTETDAVTTKHTLGEWLASPAGLGTPNLANNGTQYYKMDISIDESITTSGSTNFDFIFTGTQTP